MFCKCNKNVTLYELYNLVWYGISYDRDKLVQFVQRYNKLKFLSKFFSCCKHEFKLLDIIYKSYDKTTLDNILANDENTIRLCLIEKWARIAAMDILVHNSFGRTTYETISNLPLRDYKLILKRVEELVQLAQKVANQSNKISDNTSGL